MTNKEKFKEVFGFIPAYDQRYDVCPDGFDCDVMPCKECQFNDYWWEREYKKCFRLKEAKND